MSHKKNELSEDQQKEFDERVRRQDAIIRLKDKGIERFHSLGRKRHGVPER